MKRLPNKTLHNIDAVFWQLFYITCYSQFLFKIMTVSELIKELSKIDGDKMVILTEPDGIGWDNVGKIIEEECQVKITMDGNGLFQDS